MKTADGATRPWVQIPPSPFATSRIPAACGVSCIRTRAFASGGPAWRRRILRTRERFVYGRDGYPTDERRAPVCGRAARGRGGRVGLWGRSRHERPLDGSGRRLEPATRSQPYLPAPCSTAPPIGWRCGPMMARSSVLLTGADGYCWPTRRSVTRPSRRPVGRSPIRPGRTGVTALTLPAPTAPASASSTRPQAWPHGCRMRARSSLPRGRRALARISSPS